ncbi:gamma-glutamylcyclotransferase family protein [Rhodopseudomonas sp. NSM]|uniref:gamma-glutamylcyclotransferase family protein n=1 Tax=Rhodopseudomonas sp. NSM TaxID=3457630 RepID=UPI004036D5B1
MLDRLFVYGTLMRGFDNPMARLLSVEAECLGPATMPGRLYRIRHYPGLVAAAVPADIVFGEVFRMRRPRELLAQLDDYEGCGPGDAEPAEYRRDIASVTLANGAAIEVFVYIYNWEVADLPRIVSGRFRPDSAG